ncbi:MAG: carboxypeptidase-like regulatory domain-containing protein [Massilibacteroides sp.]|nr:carboxypeptidase-like regulatory domain-containing protein [Massilibacteroides sp.]
MLNEQNTDNLFVPENAVNQSDRKIKGTIMDESGDPIIGANVMVKGTAEGTITDLDGKFFMSVPDKAVLVISYVGYIKQEVKVTDQSSLRIILIEDTKILDEVVIVGYGVQKKLR